MKVTKFRVDGNDLLMPSYADGVDGLADFVETMIASYDQNTVDDKIDDLASVYLGISAKASSAGIADFAWYAQAATLDGSGRNIANTYYTTNTTVTRAAQDKFGSDITVHYARKDGEYNNLKAGYATTAGSASLAVTDSNGNTITSTYIKNITRIAEQPKIYFTCGNGQTVEVDTQDTTYQNATTLQAGLMSKEDKIKLNGIASGAQVNTVTGIKGNAESAYRTGNVDITAANVGAAAASHSHAPSDLSSAVPVSLGGTGQTNLDSVTVGKAKKWDTARLISLGGAVSGTVSLDGSASVACATSQLNFNSAYIGSGVLPTLNGGTGNSNGTAAALTSKATINGIESNLGASTNLVWHGVCNTAAATAEKTVSITGFKLVEGAIVNVRFTYQNTAAQPTLNVNGTGAKAINTNAACDRIDFASQSPWTYYSGGVAISTPSFNFISFCYHSNVWYVIRPTLMKLDASRTISLQNGASGSVSFDGSANVTIPVNNLNMNYATGGVLDKAYGGTGNSDGTVAKLTTPRTINTVPFDGSANVCIYGTCASAASDTAKVATIANPGSDTGLISSVPTVFCINFSNANTAENVTLNVNNTGAVSLYRGSTKITSANIFSAYDNCVVWLQRRTSGGQITGYRVLDSSQLCEVKLTGDVTGSDLIAKNSVVSISTTVQPSAFTAKTITSDSTVYGANIDSIQAPGFYRLAAIGQWKNRPSNTNANATHYLNVLGKKASGNGSCFQQLFHYKTGSMWIRALPNGDASQGNGWQHVQTTAVNTVTSISGGTSEEAD